MYKKYKRLVYTPPDLLARFCKANLSNGKKFCLICFPRICFPGLIYCDQEPLNVKCDGRWLPVFGCTSTAINSMKDLVHSWTVGKLLFLVSNHLTLIPQKSHECALKWTDLWNTSVLFDLNYKFINESFAFSPG